MTKRILSIILAITLILGMSVSTFAITQPVSVNINGSNLELKDAPYMDGEGRLMVPLREILEYLEYEVTWDQENKEVTALNDLNNIQLRIGERNIKSKIDEVEILTAPVIKNSRTYIPLDFLSKALDFVVGWDSKHQLLNIYETIESDEDFFKISDNDLVKANLHSYMDALEKNKGFFGSVLVAKDDSLLISQGYGFSNVEQETLNKAQSKFAIGSVTKQFVAMAIMQLSEGGLINVEDKLSKYMPELKYGEEITIHNLLTHSSGLASFTDLSEFYLNPKGYDGPNEILDLVKDKDLAFEPGKGFAYSNTNYLILGIIIEEVTGMTYADYIEKNILQPLNMKNTGFSYDSQNEIYDATAYSGHLEVAAIDDEILLANAYGAGSMFSTVEDLYRWDQALKTEKLVKSETLEKIFANHVDMLGQGYYGYGWMLADLGFDRIVYHGGNTLGFTADNTRLVETDLTVIILSNKGYADLTSIKNDLIKIVLGMEVELPKAREVIEIENLDIYDKYVGKYELMPGQDLNIIRQEDKLYGQVDGQVAFELFPENESSFFAKLVDVQIEFIEDEDGKVNELVFKQNPLVLNSRRKGEEAKKEVVLLDPEVYEDYIGDYELMPGFILAISVDEGSFYAQLTGQGKVEIYPSSEVEFFNDLLGLTITILKDEANKVSGLVLKQGGQELIGEKI